MEIYRSNSIKVRYLECMLEETMSGETMTLSFINKVNNKLKYLYGKNRFFNACSALCPNLIKKLKNRIHSF